MIPPGGRANSQVFARKAMGAKNPYSRERENKLSKQKYKQFMAKPEIKRQ